MPSSVAWWSGAKFAAVAAGFYASSAMITSIIFNLVWRSAVTRLDMVLSLLVLVLSDTLTSSSRTKYCSVGPGEYATLSSESARNPCCIFRLF